MLDRPRRIEPRGDHSIPPDPFYNRFSERTLRRRTFIKLLAAAGVLAPSLLGGAPAIPSDRSSVPLDDLAVLTILGILQPTSVDAFIKFIKLALSEMGEDTDAVYLLAAFERYLDSKQILRVKSGPPDLFSLTAVGNASLPREAQFLRDRARLFLMRGRARVKGKTSRGDGLRAGGVPPPSWIRARIEDFILRSEPQAVGFEGLGDRRSRNRPSLREALPRFLSFESLDQVNAALGNADPTIPLSLDGVALCLGISSTLLAWFVEKPEKSYREFQISKRVGGTRTIESPRIFLKVTQRLILHFFLSDLRVHNAVYSFRHGRSPAANAIQHEGLKFIGGLDIRNYFGSVTLDMLVKCLVENGFNLDLAKKLGRLLTRRDLLPQGAPTSPILSNALLFGFDENMTFVCAELGLNYTRYADDMVISGESRPAIEKAFTIAHRELRTRYGLLLNDQKTRIVPRHRRQWVTGAVVNKSAAPPRNFRRKLRAVFHEADKEPARFTKEVKRLTGYVGYLQGFPSLRNSPEISHYRSIIDRVRGRT
jgi:hypothetical protein